jgi:hypothetical protein
MNRDQIAKAMMFATANLINNEDPTKVPQLTTEYWEAAVAFNNEFADDDTLIALCENQITEFVNHLQNA